jgi:3',5'-cyclic AMP phosphodiesterase CpdA
MTFRMAQISDTHLSGAKPFFLENFQVVAAAVAASAPDLVVSTGDMALDGVGREDDLAQARRLHDAIGLPVRYLPGNHDIGESQDVPGAKETPISDDSRARYMRHFGDDFWYLDVPGWRLVAIDSQLLGSELPAAQLQLELIVQAAASRAARQLALLIHKPLFDASAAEAAVTGRFINPQARERLLAAFGEHQPAVVASGHVHQYRSTLVGATRHVWAPSTGFIVPDARQPRYGEKEVGYVEHRFERDGTHAAAFVRVPGLKRLDIADFAEAAYGVRM